MIPSFNYIKICKPIKERKDEVIMLLTLKNQGYTVTLETLGAELKSYKNEKGKEFVWDSNPDFWPRSAPLLFPSIGNLRNNRTIINGKEYQIPKHGFVRDIDMDYKLEAENKVTFSCRSSEETLKCYPFRFHFQQTYELNGPELFTTYIITNEDDTEMYYHLGAHPGFMCPLEEGENFSDYVLKFPFAETCDSPVYDLENMQFDPASTRRYLDNSDTLKLDYSLFDIDAIVFPHLKSKSVQLINPATGKGLQMDYPDFSTIAFWTPAQVQAPFLCMEPWNGAAIFADEDNEFIHKRDIQTLKAGESRTYRLNIRLLV